MTIPIRDDGFLVFVLAVRCDEADAEGIDGRVAQLWRYKSIAHSAAFRLIVSGTRLWRTGEKGSLSGTRREQPVRLEQW
jgi:hypothetical protein